MYLIDIAVLAASGGLVILAGFAIYRLAQEAHTSNPTLKAILLALQPYALKAIFTGEYLAFKSLDGLGKRFTGIDKKALADKWYDLLPQSLHVGPVSLPISYVKSVVTREMFEGLIDNAFRETEAEILQAENVFKNAPTISS